MPSCTTLPRHKGLNGKQCSVRSGDDQGAPWPSKQIRTCLRRFSTAEAKPQAIAQAKAEGKGTSQG